MTDRPEDIANRNYYQHTMLTRRVRVTYEADIEWREDEPGYCLDVARTDGQPSISVRLLHPEIVSAELLPGKPIRVDQCRSDRHDVGSDD